MLFLGGLFFYACNDDDDNGDEVTEKKCYLTKMFENDTLDTEIIWNTENQLTRVNDYDGNVNDSYMEITWTNGKVTRIQWYGLDEKKAQSSKWVPKIQLKLEKSGVKSFSLEMYETFTYTDGKLTQSERFFLESNEWVSYGTDTYEYTGDNISKATFSDGEYTYSYYTFTYDANGNLTEDKLYYTGEEDVLMEKNTYTYDDKKSMFSYNGLPLLMAFLVSPNNILTETYSYYNWDTGELEGTEEFTYAYTYNDDDYPITRVETDVSEGETYNYTLEYNCTE